MCIPLAERLTSCSVSTKISLNDSNHPQPLLAGSAPKAFLPMLPRPPTHP
jgi:hypothetical protein